LARRAAKTQLTPWAAKAKAMARPIPALAPVMMATFPFMV
jgi:hypothetical protein